MRKFTLLALALTMLTSCIEFDELSGSISLSNADSTIINSTESGTSTLTSTGTSNELSDGTSTGPTSTGSPVTSNEPINSTQNGQSDITSSATPTPEMGDMVLMGAQTINLPINSSFVDQGVQIFNTENQLITVAVDKTIEKLNGSTWSSATINNNAVASYRIKYKYGQLEKIRYLNFIPATTTANYININDVAGINKRNVNSISNFKSLASSANPGDAVILANGTYSNIGTVNITVNGTASNPIYFVAETAGSVFIEGVSTITISGNYIVLIGFVFKNGSPNTDKGAINVTGSYNRVHNNAIYYFNDTTCYKTSSDDFVSGDCKDTKWISLNGNNNEVDNNSFIGKRAKGALMVVWRDNTAANFHHIHHNYFADFERNVRDPKDTNGWEGIRIGDSTESQSDSHSVIEYNVFEKMNGEIEIISNKSGANIYRGNVMIDCGGMLTIRHGKGVIAESNIFLPNQISGGGGIRFYDTDHIIRNNYIFDSLASGDQRGGIVIHSGNNNDGETTTINGQWTARDVLIHSNSMINVKNNFVYSGKETKSPERITFYNNLVSSATVSSSVAINQTNNENTPDIAHLKNSTYLNELYSAKSAGINPIPAGVTYQSTALSLTTVDQFKYHSDLIGAKNLYQVPISLTIVSYTLPTKPANIYPA